MSVLSESQRRNMKTDECFLSFLSTSGHDSPVFSFQGRSLRNALHGSVHNGEHAPMMRAGESHADAVVSLLDVSPPSLGSNVCAVLCAQVCKVYRFQTEDRRWLLVREQMCETPLSFSVPKQLLSALIREHTDR